MQSATAVWSPCTLVVASLEPSIPFLLLFPSSSPHLRPLAQILYHFIHSLVDSSHLFFFQSTSCLLLHLLNKADAVPPPHLFPGPDYLFLDLCAPLVSPSTVAQHMNSPSLRFAMFIRRKSFAL